MIIYLFWISAARYIRLFFFARGEMITKNILSLIVIFQGNVAELVTKGGDKIYDIESQGNNIIAGGANGIVYIYDYRKCRQIRSWRAPLSHDIVALSSTSGHVFCAGSGYELMSFKHLDNLEEERAKRKKFSGKLKVNHSKGLRVSDRWLGIDSFHVPNTVGDVVIGSVLDGTFYIVTNAEELML